MTENQKIPYAWGWIIFWFIMFWPLGLFLLVRKLSAEKSATLQGSRIMTILSYILMGIGGLFFITSCSSAALVGRDFPSAFAGGMPSLFIYGIGGILLNRYAAKTRLTAERYRKYIDLIINQNQTSLNHISFSVGESYDVVIKDLEKMIASGYFVGAYIDTNRGEIVLTPPVPLQQTDSFSPSAFQGQERVVACNCCGANNRVVGQVGRCEYCSSPIG